MHREHNGFMRTLALGVGFGIGVLWIALGIAAFWTSARGLAHDRLDWGVGWGLVGLLITLAGASAIGATWWHQFRVKPGH